MGFAEVLAAGLADEAEVADEAPGDVDEATGIEEVRVTPAAAHVCWAICKDVWRSLPVQLALMH